MKRSGYVFKGWNTQADGNGTMYLEGNSFKTGKIDKDTELYAIWSVESGGGTTPGGGTNPGGGTTPGGGTNPGGGTTPGTTPPEGTSPQDGSILPDGSTPQGGSTVPSKSTIPKNTGFLKKSVLKNIPQVAHHLPKTGDGLNPTLFAGLSLILGSALTFIGYRRRKNQR